MNEQLRLLTELQKLDAEIIEKNSLIKAIPAKISEVERPLKEAQANLERQRQKYEAAEKKKKERERELDDINDRIKKLKARTAEIKDNKAYQAHLKEIEAVEKSRYEVEDSILVLMEAIDGEGKQVKAADAMLLAEKAKEAELRKELDIEVAEAQKALDGLKSVRKNLTSGIEADNYSIYMRVLRESRGLAVVEAKDERCQGCNMNIMPQLFVEIKRNERIIQCPQCGRVLYYGGK